MTELDTRPAETDTGSGTPHYAHIVRRTKSDAEAEVTEAHVFGTELVALCGYRWVPSRDPVGLPVCPACREAISRLP